MSETRLAVAFVHGVLISDEEFHVAPADHLRRHFTEAFAAGAPDPDEALVVEPVHWAPVLHEKQRYLFDRVASPEQRDAVAGYEKEVKRLNAGERKALLNLTGPFLKQWKGSEMHWMALRWLLVHFVGDALGYPDSPSTQRNYQEVQDLFARALRSLRQRAGPNAPLAVIAHSLGTVVTSDFFYDMQSGKQAGGKSPLERGETFFSFHSLGSPLWIWALRSDERGMGSPISVPANELSGHHPGLRGGWFNYYDPDDVIAAPLRGLSDAYENAVKEDREVCVGGPIAGRTPLSHPFYWTEPSLMRIVGYRLAEAYATLNPRPGRQLVPAVY